VIKIGWKNKPLPAEVGSFLFQLNVICFEPQNIEVKNIALFF